MLQAIAIINATDHRFIVIDIVTIILYVLSVLIVLLTIFAILSCESSQLKKSLERIPTLLHFSPLSSRLSTSYEGEINNI